MKQQKRRVVITLTKVIGFLGVEKYDLILYLAYILKELNQKILIMDASDQRALTCCIPHPKELNSETETITFREIDFIRDFNPDDYVRDYDYILIDYGFKVRHHDLKGCTTLFACLDRQKHNITAINQLALPSDEVYLILRDIGYQSDADIVVQELGFKAKEVIPLIYDEHDKRSMVALQSQERININSLSGDYRYLLRYVIETVFGIDKKDFKLAYKRMRKRVNEW